jgi:hypothetical protein
MCLEGLVSLEEPTRVEEFGTGPQTLGGTAQG